MNDDERMSKRQPRKAGPQLNTLLAHKALNLFHGLTKAEIKVAASIIDHYNVVTGRCDPGVERICRLTALARRTVLRAVANLHRDGIIFKTTNAGRSRSNSYQPNWQIFENVLEELRAGMKVDASARVPKSPPRVPKLASEGAKNGTQTGFQTDLRTGSRAHETTWDEILGDDFPAERKKIKRAAKDKNLSKGQRYILHVLPGGKDRDQPSGVHPEAAKAGLRRLRRELSNVAGDERLALELFLVDQDGVQEAAVLAECHQRGAGLQYIRDAFARSQSAAGGRT
jgi:predicted transcriptional regulator